MPQGQAAVAGPAGGVLVDGEAGVDALAFEEQPADRGARALRRDQDHVDVLRRHDAGLVAVDDAEAVREVQGLAAWSGSGLSVGHCSFWPASESRYWMMVPRCGGLLEREERLAGHPAVLLGQVPALPPFAQADDDVDAVVLHVERLAAALDAVAEDGDGLVAEDRLDPLRRVVGPLDARSRRCRRS